ncbi:MAG: ABC transporter ATP-binding protein [Alphaproteobacteria bacterium]
MTEMIAIDGLVKKFGPITAVAGVTFRVEKGEVLGFLGPNGAGKTTTMRMITGFLPPTAGTARVCGIDVTRSPIETKARIGYLPEGAPSYFDMTADSYLGFIANIRGLTGAEKKRHIDVAVERAHIREVMGRPIETLSKGYKRRVALAQAILHDPDILILDEPTEGLDPNQKFEVRGLIREMAAEKAIIISTHLLEEVEPVCTRAVVISRGRLVADGTPRELLSRAPFHNAVQISLGADTAGAAAAALRQLPRVDSVERLESGGDLALLRVVPKGRASIISEVTQLLRDKNISTEEILVDPGSLEDVFRDLTTGATKNIGAAEAAHA